MEKSAELAEEIKSNNDEMEELGEQIDENNKRLLELASLESPSIADEEEIKNLKEENTLLEAQLALLKNINEQKALEQQQYDTSAWNIANKIPLFIGIN